MATPEQLPRSAERLAVSALTLVGFAIALNVQVLAALGPFLKVDLGLDGAQFGTLVSAGWIGGAAGSLLLLPIVDRVGRRGPILIGSLAFALASAGHFVWDDYASLLVVRAVAGLAGGGVFTVASAAVADLVPYARRGRAMGVFNLSIFLAAPIGMPIATACAEAGSWPAIFGVQVVIALVATLGVATTLPRDLGKGGGTGLDWRVLTLPSVLPALLSVVLYSGAFATSVQFLGIWLDTAGIVARGDQASVWIALGVVSAIGTVVLTRFADRFGKRNFVVAMSCIVGVGLAALGFVDGTMSLILVGVPVAACTAARSGAMLALVTGLAPADRRGSLMVMRSVAVSGGMGLLVWVGGSLYRLESNYAHVLWFAAGSVAVSLILVLVAVREVGK